MVSGKRKARAIQAIGCVLAFAAVTAAAAELPVYDATQVALDRYVIVKRIWADSWRTAFWIGGESNEAAARRAVIAQAEDAGADAVVNLTCLSRTDRMFRRSGHYCYGDAIKARAAGEPKK